MHATCEFESLIPARDLRIGVISNANSGHNRSMLTSVDRILSRHACVHHVITRGDEQVLPALLEMARRDIDVLAINGGDGTAAGVLGRILDHQPFRKCPAIVLLPGGTINLNASSIGMGSGLLGAATRFGKWIGTGRHPCERSRHSILRVQPGGTARAAYGMFLGAGAVIQGTDYAHRQIHSRGLRGSTSLGLTMARTLWGMRRRDPRFRQPVTVSMAMNDEGPLVQHQALVLIASSLQRLSLGLNPFWGTEPAPVRLTLVADHAERFMRSLPSVLRGRPNGHVRGHAGYLSHNAHRIRLAMDGAINLDGEIHHVRHDDGPLRISRGGEFTFLRV